MPIDYKEYPKNWLSEIRPAILARDGNCCKFCGVHNYDLVERAAGFTKIVLTIAHLDQDKTNNDFENLAALCQRCHLGHDMKHHVANRKETNRKNKGLQNLF